VTEKQCSRCKRLLPATAFGPDRARKDGLKSYCRECIALIARERRAGRRPEFAAIPSDRGNQPKRKAPGSWNLDNTGRDTRRKPKRRPTRAQRIIRSIVAARAELTLQRRALVRAQAQVAETKVHLQRLEALQEKLSAAQERAA
jgi:hypothetical protein